MYVPIVVIFVLILLLIIFAFISLSLSYVAISHEQVGVLMNAELKTGDLILLRHKKYRSPWLSGFVSHMGVIWYHSIVGPLVIDMNPDEGPWKKPIPFDFVFQGPSVVAIRLRDFLTFYPGDVYVRCLSKPLTLEQELLFIEKLKWAFSLEYIDAIKDRDVFTWLTLALSFFFPFFSHTLLPFTSLDQIRTSSFCTEMVHELFIATGLMEKGSYWAPIAWVKGIGSSQGLKDDLWDPHLQII